jgi:RecB family exonuclease
VDDDRFQGLLIVPESDLPRALRRGERAETLPSLRTTLRRALAPDLELAEPIAVRIAIAGVAPGVAADDPRLGAMARRGGRGWLRLVDAMHDALGSLIGREEALAVVSRGEDSLAVRARFLSRLAASLDRALFAAGLVDPRREAERIAERVARADPHVIVEVLGARDLRARGIVEWTAADLAMWRVLDASLSRVGGRASIELPVFERPLDAERERDPLDALIEAIAAALDDAPLTESIAPKLGDLQMGKCEPALDVPVEVRRADGKEAQGRAVADAVHEALASGAAPESVVVGLASGDDRSALQILRALEDLGIPSTDARRVRTPRSNLLSLADTALEVAARGSERLDVVRLLRSSYVDPRIVMNEVDRESASRALSGLARCLEETPTANGGTPGARLGETVAASSSVGPELRSRLAPRAAHLGASLARVAKTANRAEHVERLRALHHDLGLAAAPPVLAAPPGGRIAHADVAARARDADAWDCLGETLEAHERATVRLGLLRDEVTLETFRHEVAWSLKQHFSSRRPVPNGVRILSLTDLPSEESSLVVVADADAGSWPDGRAAALLVPSALEDRLLRVGDPSLRPLALSGTAQVLARLSLATSRARRVVFTYRTHDDDGAPLSPAPVVASIARSASVSSFRATTSLSRPCTDRERALSALAENPSRAPTVPPDVARRAALERRREEAFGLPLAETHPLVAGMPRGPLFEPILTDEIGGGSRPLTASAVDRLASCVFQGFVSEVLRPRRRQAAHDVADAREEGNITHAGLEAAFLATTSLWSARPRDRETILRRGLAAADAVIGGGVASELARTVAVRAHAGVLAVLEWSIADEEWDFARAEQSFGDASGWHALVLGEGGARVTIRGRIDRVDVAHRPHERTSVRVIDYKARASSAESYTARFGATTFQLALYGRIAAEALERAAAAGLYLGTRRLGPGDAPKRHLERWNDAHVREEGVARFERAVLGRVAEARQGRVEVRPYDASSCERCDYEGVCRKPRFLPTLPGDDEPPIEDES